MPALHAAITGAALKGRRTQEIYRPKLKLLCTVVSPLCNVSCSYYIARYLKNKVVQYLVYYECFVKILSEKIFNSKTFSVSSIYIRENCKSFPLQIFYHNIIQYHLSNMFQNTQELITNCIYIMSKHFYSNGC